MTHRGIFKAALIGACASLILVPAAGASSENRDLLTENVSYQYERGVSHFEAGNYDAARKSFKRIVNDYNPYGFKNSTRDALAQYYLGLSEQKMGNHKDAVRHLSLSRNMFPGAPQIHVALSRSLIARGEHMTARKVRADVDALARECAGSCAAKGDIETARVILAGMVNKT